jgi:methylthioribose-1-phosphate isomerase
MSKSRLLKGDSGLPRVPAIVWQNGLLKLLDQRRLPLEIIYLDCRNHGAVADAIQKMVVRGAPAIGAAAAYGMLLAARIYAACGASTDSRVAGAACPVSQQFDQFKQQLVLAAEELRRTRPTAVNLEWALQRVLAAVEQTGSPAEAVQVLEREAALIASEDVEANRAIGKFGATLIKDGDHIITHCNAGALATVDYGTALGVIRAAHEEDKRIHVYADETRPYLQGARLTTWELMQDGIPVTLITDNMAAWVMAAKKADLVIVGADRVAANGDVANKIGTYGLAVLAKFHKIPFYVAAPLSSIDLSIASGQDIVIEERAPEEVTHVAGQQVAPTGVTVFNPAFDVTPAALITAVITEKGVFKGSAAAGLKSLGVSR